MKRSIMFIGFICVSIIPSGFAGGQNTTSGFEPCAILSVTASSEDLNHKAAFAVDGRRATWWSPSTGKSKNEWILVDFQRGEKVTAVEIVNGAQGVDAAKRSVYRQYSRVKKGLVELSNGTKTPFELTDSPEAQRIVVPTAEVRWVKIYITSVYSGQRKKSPCITQINVLKIVPIYSL